MNFSWKLVWFDGETSAKLMISSDFSWKFHNFDGDHSAKISFSGDYSWRFLDFTAWSSTGWAEAIQNRPGCSLWMIIFLMEYEMFIHNPYKTISWMTIFRWRLKKSSRIVKKKAFGWKNNSHYREPLIQNGCSVWKWMSFWGKREKAVIQNHHFTR